MTESTIPPELLSRNSTDIQTTSSVKDQDSLIFWYLFDRGTAFTLVLRCLLILRLLDSQWGCVLVLRLEDWFSPFLYTSVGMFFVSGAVMFFCLFSQHCLHFLAFLNVQNIRTR